jgi:hypothetical protein
LYNTKFIDPTANINLISIDSSAPTKRRENAKQGLKNAVFCDMTLRRLVEIYFQCGVGFPKTLLLANPFQL